MTTADEAEARAAQHAADRLQRRITALVGEERARQWYDIVRTRAYEGRVSEDYVLRFMADTFEDGKKTQEDRNRELRERASHITDTLISKHVGAFITERDGIPFVTLSVTNGERLLNLIADGISQDAEEGDLFFSEPV